MPGLPQGINAISVSTPRNLVLDAGVLYRNIDAEALRNGDGFDAAIENAQKLGATRGGASFNSNKENRQVEVDGKRLPIRELNRTDMLTPTLTVTLLEHTKENIAMYFGQVDVEEHDNFDEFTERIEINDDDYTDNIALFATIGGSDDPVCLLLENVLCVSATELTFEDKSELAVECELVAHALVSNPSAVPYHVFRPNDIMS